ncbi:MAG: LytTR family DNA-binding domain-containing protein [Verrucomicrobiota bacterium]
MPAQELHESSRSIASRVSFLGIAFFVIVPLALAAITTTTTGYSQRLGYGETLLYVSHLSLIPWWIGEGTTRLAHYTLRRWRPPLWLLCTIGILVACIFVAPYVSLVNYIFDRFASGDDTGATSSSQAQSSGIQVLIQVGRALFFWITANYLFDRLLGYPRFRYEDVSTDDSSDAAKPLNSEEEPVELIRRLKEIESLSEIIIVKADEHYIRVFTADTEEFIPYKFSTALSDLEGEDGFQVHRSYWVRRAAVAGKIDTGSQLMLEVSNGAEVPVSRPHHALVRQVFTGLETS